MSDITLGLIITDEQERDAIHIAIAPVIAAVTVYRGEHIGFVREDNLYVGTDASERIGIVDPFLKWPVKSETKFWMLLYPNTITSLRHDWTHPAFENSNSADWLRTFAKHAGLGYQEMMSIVAEYCETGKPWVEPLIFPCAEFWKHFENVTLIKRPTDEDYWPSPFSCSC